MILMPGWMQRKYPDGVPFLVSPALEYDIELNRYFLRPAMIGAAQNTRLAVAGDLCRFLRFLHESRGGKSWRDAQEDDHAAFLYWRRFDPAGPRVAASTWNRELALVNGFFAWAAGQQLVAANPVPQRARRAAADRRRHGQGGALVPAAQARDTGRDEVQWLTPAEYRQWRDTGLRGYRADGLPDEGFRGRWASRNAVLADLMVRTGLRLAEQASLTVQEIPVGEGGAAYQRFWLPEAVAKNGSSRWVYLPAALARKAGEYCAADRAEIIAAARRRGTYDRIRDPLVLDPGRDPASAVVVRRPGVGQRWDVGQFGEAQAVGKDGVEVVLQRPVVVVGLDADFPQAAVAAELAGVEVVGDVAVDDGAVGVVEGEYEPACGLERGGEPAVVGDVVEDQVAGGGVKGPGRGWQWLAEVGHLVVDAAVWGFCPGQLDQVRERSMPVTCAQAASTLVR